MQFEREECFWFWILEDMNRINHYKALDLTNLITHKKHILNRELVEKRGTPIRGHIAFLM